MRLMSQPLACLYFLVVWPRLWTSSPKRKMREHLSSALSMQEACQILELSHQWSMSDIWIGTKICGDMLNQLLTCWLDPFWRNQSLHFVLCAQETSVRQNKQQGKLFLFKKWTVSYKKESVETNTQSYTMSMKPCSVQSFWIWIFTFCKV